MYHYQHGWEVHRLCFRPFEDYWKEIRLIDIFELIGRIIKARADRSARCQSITHARYSFPQRFRTGSIMQSSGATRKDEAWRKFRSEKKSKEHYSIPLIAIVAFTERNDTALMTKKGDSVPARTMFRCWSLRCHLSITETSTQAIGEKKTNIELKLRSLLPGIFILFISS